MGHPPGRLADNSHISTALLVAADTAAILLSIFVSFILRFDEGPWSHTYHEHLQPYLASLPVAVAVYLLSFSMFRLYRCAWRFAGLEVLWLVVRANTVGIAALVAIQSLIYGSILPRSVLIMTWAATIILTGATRIFLRMVCVAKQQGRDSTHRPALDRRHKRAVILGAGTDGARIQRAVSEDPSLCYKIIGFLDDDHAKLGTYINNVPVLGPVGLVRELVEDDSVDEVIVALPEACNRKLKESVLRCRERKVPVKIIPQLKDALTGQAGLQLVDFSIEDLLRRPPAAIDLAVIGRYLAGKRVLVTGAGGSIGSELCRQIVSMDPASLVLVGHGENSIHLILQELITRFPHMRGRIEYAIASVSHRLRVDQVFDRYRPQIVFHAAAHKHVPIMETNEQEAVSNNVLGSSEIADACGRFGIERVVLISTDKAANPCSVMGATKWLCEEVFRAAAVAWPTTSFITVRFGNVLGSRGSVVPIFRDQIIRGGPVTVTHPDMTRYFMTIPEAVRLVLQAGAVGKSGELYLLEMGDPVNITEMARDMIQIHGFEPGVDIEIKFTGVRPGEKLHELLISGDERIKKTPWEGLTLVDRPEYFTYDEMMAALDRLQRATDHGNPADVRRLLNHLIPGACNAQTQDDEDSEYLDEADVESAGM